MRFLADSPFAQASIPALYDMSTLVDSRPQRTTSIVLFSSTIQKPAGRLTIRDEGPSACFPDGHAFATLDHFVPDSHGNVQTVTVYAGPLAGIVSGAWDYQTEEEWTAAADAVVAERETY